VIGNTGKPPTINPDSEASLSSRQRVEVALIAEEVEAARAVRLAEFKALFQTTQALPQAQAISDDDIAAEIAAYRAGQ